MTSDQNQFFDCFVSYRRMGGSDVASLIKIALEERYGFSLFLDVDSLPGGRFDERLLNTIRHSTNFMLVLAPGSLDRCKNEGDWLRREIVTAIDAGANIIPVMTNGFAFPDEGELPPDIRPVVKFNGVRYEHEFRDPSIAKIASFFVKNGKRITPAELVRLSEVAKTRSGSATGPSVLKRVTIGLLSAAAFFVCFFAVLAWWLHSRPVPEARMDLPKPAVLAAPVVQAPAAQTPGNSVSVRTTPSGARACLDGKEIKITPATFTNLEKREYTLTLVADGYEPVETSIRAGNVEYEELPVYTLVRSVGNLEITSGDASVHWALLSVPDGAVKMSAMTPNVLTSMPTGDYVVRFSRDGWLPCTEAVTVKRGETVRVAHVYSEGALNVASNAADATWRIVSAPADMDKNSKALPQSGSVPAKLAGVPAGSYDVVFSRNGWMDATVHVVVPAFKSAVAMYAYPSASLDITSNIQGVRWRLIGNAEIQGLKVKEGAVPFSLSELPKGTYVILFSRPGWMDIQEEVDLGEGERKSVRHEYHSGTLELAANGDRAGWTVVSAPSQYAGLLQGVVPAKLQDVPPGRYVVAFRRDGWPDEKVEVTVGVDKVVRAYGAFVGCELHIDSSPSGADVFAVSTNEFLGKTPLVLRDVKPGDYVFAISKHRFKPTRISGVAHSGGTQEAHVDLEPDWTMP